MPGEKKTKTKTNLFQWITIMLNAVILEITHLISLQKPITKVAFWDGWRLFCLQLIFPIKEHNWAEGHSCFPCSACWPADLCSQQEPSREHGEKCLSELISQVDDFPDIQGSRQQLKKGMRKYKCTRKVLENSGTNK